MSTLTAMALVSASGLPWGLQPSGFRAGLWLMCS